MNDDMVRASHTERIRRALPYAWLKAKFTPTTTEMSDLQLASIAHAAAIRCAAKWRPERMRFRDYVEMTVERDLHAADARAEALTYAERALQILTEVESHLTVDSFFDDDLRFGGDLR